MTTARSADALSAGPAVRPAVQTPDVVGLGGGWRSSRFPTHAGTCAKHLTLRGRFRGTGFSWRHKARACIVASLRRAPHAKAPDGDCCPACKVSPTAEHLVGVDQLLDPSLAELSPAILAMQSGDASGAERELVARRAARLALRTVSALTPDRDRADDVSQDVCIEVIRSIKSLRNPESFDAWVHRITVRRAMKVFRDRSRRRGQELPLAFQEDHLETAPDRQSGVSLRHALAAAMVELPRRQKLALALRYIHDLSDEDIAAALDCRAGTVHSLLSRARRQLRESSELQSFRPTEGDA